MLYRVYILAIWIKMVIIDIPVSKIMVSRSFYGGLCPNSD